MKLIKYLCMLTCVALLLSSCSNIGVNGQISKNSEIENVSSISENKPSSMLTESKINNESTATESKIEKRKNAAIDKTDELKNISDDMYAGMVYYYTSPNWQNILKIENIEEADTIGKSVYLFVPYYVGSNIQVYELKFDEQTSELINDKLIYEKSDTLDDYGLVIECMEPEGIPYYSIVLSYGNETITHHFQSNGKGEYPYTKDGIYINQSNMTRQILDNDYYNYSGRFLAPYDYGHGGPEEMIYFKMNLPDGSYATEFYYEENNSHINWNDYDIEIWGYYLDYRYIYTLNSFMYTMQNIREIYSLRNINDNGIRIERGAAKPQNECLVYGVEFKAESESDKDLYMFLTIRRNDNQDIKIDQVAGIDAAAVTILESCEITDKILKID